MRYTEDRLKYRKTVARRAMTVYLARLSDSERAGLRGAIV